MNETRKKRDVMPSAGRPSLALWCKEFVARPTSKDSDSNHTMWTARDLIALYKAEYSRGLVGHVGRELRRLGVFSYKLRYLMRCSDELKTVWCIPDPPPHWTAEILRDAYRSERDPNYLAPIPMNRARLLQL